MYFYAMILITGGTGLVGGHLLYRFRESDTPIKVLYREASSIDKTRLIFNSYEENGARFIDRFQWVQGDVLDVPSLQAAMKGVTQVYHCAAVIDEADFYIMKKVNVTGTANVVNVALSHHVTKMCYVSSIATIGDPVGDRSSNEEDFFNLDAKNTSYAITKYGGEMEVWRATQEGMNVVIVNPGVIIGEGDMHSGSGRIFKKIMNGLSFYTSGTTGFVDVRDLVRIMEQLMTSDLINQRYVVVAENMNFKELLSAMATAMNVTIPRFKMSKGLLYFVSGITKLGSWIGFPRVLERASVNTLTRYSQYDNSKLRDQLKVEFTDINQAIKRVSAFYKRL